MAAVIDATQLDSAAMWDDDRLVEVAEVHFVPGGMWQTRHENGDIQLVCGRFGADLTWDPKVGKWTLRIERVKKAVEPLGKAVMALRHYVQTTYPGMFIPKPRVDRRAPIWRMASVSQIDTYTRCKRAWWYQQIAGARRRSSDAADLGTQVHRAVESWAKQGTPPDRTTIPGALAQQVIDVLQIVPHDPGLELERGFEVRITGDIVLTGSKDIVDRRTPGVYAVLDIKSSKDPGRYGKHGAALLRDRQLNTYLMESLLSGEASDEQLVIGHVRVQTEHPWAVSHELHNCDLDVAAATWQRNVDTIGQMAETAALTVAEHVEATLGGESCDAYGGCFAKPWCSARAARRK